MYSSSSLSSSSRRKPFQATSSSSQKRSRSALTARMIEADDDDDDGNDNGNNSTSNKNNSNNNSSSSSYVPSPPPNKKQLTFSSAVALTSFSTTSARHDILQTEVDTLQAELEHATTVRELDQRKHQSEITRLHKKLEFAIEEAKEAQQLMEEVRKESDAYVQQQQEARKRSQKELRKTQSELNDALLKIAHYEAKELEGRMISSTTSSSSSSSHETNSSLRERWQAQRTENEHLKEVIQQLQDDLKHTKQTMEDQRVELLTPKEPTISEASPPVMRELNKIRIELAESERKQHKYKRAAEQVVKVQKQLLQQDEKTKSFKRKATLLENELSSRTRETERLAAKLQAWKQFGAMVQQKLQPAGGQRVIVMDASATATATAATTNDDMPPEEHQMDKLLSRTTGVVDQLEQEKLQLEQAIAKSGQQAQELQHKINALERSQTSMDKMQQEFDKKVAVHEQQVKILQGQEHVWKRELESLRSIVSTFDSLPLAQPPGTGTGNSSATAASISNKDDNPRILKVQLNSAQEEIKVLKNGQATLKEDLNKALDSRTDLQKTHNTVLEKFGKLKDALYAERSKAEDAEQRACRAEELAGKGSFNPNTTRVVHLSHNPLTEALKQEVAVLKRQIQVLKTQKPTAAAATPNDKRDSISSTTAGAAVATVGNDVDPNKLHQRLKESFKEQIGRFREGVYLMTGFKIDMIPDERPKFKVRSVFAEQEQDHLLFQWPTGKNVSSLDLLGTELAQTLTTTPSYEYVQRFHSIPAFLASVQLNLFEKQTMM